jgi:hypothetical protein
VCFLSGSVTVAFLQRTGAVVALVSLMCLVAALGFVGCCHFVGRVVWVISVRQQHALLGLQAEVVMCRIRILLLFLTVASSITPIDQTSLAALIKLLLMFAIILLMRKQVSILRKCRNSLCLSQHYSRDDELDPGLSKHVKRFLILWFCSSRIARCLK